jgi:ABC-type hemin transport system ATPase subunit
VLTLLEQGRRLVTILGPGGVGKSRLLAEVGGRLSADPSTKRSSMSTCRASASANAADIADAVSVSFRLPVSREDPDDRLGHRTLCA